jgi:hypothetical protein
MLSLFEAVISENQPWCVVCCVQVREVAEEAIARARRGEGPTLIEAETYRFRGHSLADPDELRSKEEKAKYQVGHLCVGGGVIRSALGGGGNMWVGRGKEGG